MTISRTPPTETIEEYHRSGAWGSTMLGHFKSSPALAHLVMTGRYSFPETPDKRFGRWFHALMEDRGFQDKHRQGPNLSKRTKAWEKAAEEAAIDGVELIHPDDWAALYSMRDSVCADPTARAWILDAEREVAFRGDDPATYGVKVQCRADLLPADAIVDYKTTKSLDSFARSVLSYGYHRQAALYRLLVQLATGERQPRPFYFVAVEKTPPLYRCRVFGMSGAFCLMGEGEVLRLLSDIRRRTDENLWTDPTDVQVLEAPAWAGAPAAASDFEEVPADG